MSSSPSNLAPLLAKATRGRDLTSDEAAQAIRHMVSGNASPIRTAALLAALQAKGPTPSELAGGVRALREAMVPVRSDDPAALVDTCGTGGGSVSTFNISTAAAIVAAAGGVTVAKHGNRSFTSQCGSADVLEALGVRLDLSAEAAGAVLAEVGIVFMFAPLHHPALRHVGPVRKELGVTTVMNLLGPLANPAGARRQVVGVADPAFQDVVARALAELGHKRAMVVHGQPGLDEVSPCGTTRVVELRGGARSTRVVTPRDFGVERVRPEDLAGGSPAENAAMVRAVLSGADRGPRRAAVLVNAAAAFVVADRAPTLADGAAAAANAIDSGAAVAKLERLVAASRRA